MKLFALKLWNKIHYKRTRWPYMPYLKELYAITKVSVSFKIDWYAGRWIGGGLPRIIAESEGITQERLRQCLLKAIRVLEQVEAVQNRQVRR